MARGSIQITGIGLVSPLGDSLWGTFRALLDGCSITDRLTSIPGPPSPPPLDPIRLVQATGGISASLRSPDDPTIGLANRAIMEATTDANLTPADIRETPLIIASSKGAIQAGFLNLSKKELWTESPHGYLARRLQQRLGTPSAVCVVAACASGIAALDRARRMIEREEAERVIVVAVEASLIPLFIISYRRLGVLAPTTVEHYRGCPLDQNRNGFVLNDIAAAVVVESEKSSPPHTGTNRTTISLLGTRVLNEAHHIIRSSTEPMALRELARWSHEFGAIDVLHPHATGTVDNDETEMRIFAEEFGAGVAETMPAYAVKGALGHGLGAAGLVSTAIAAMIGRTGRIPPMPWLKDPIATPFPIEAAGRKGTFTRHAIFAAGFGGHTAAAIIQTR